MNIFELRLKVLNTIESFKAKRRLKKLGFCGNGAKIGEPNLLSDYSKVLLYDGAAIDSGFTLISYTGRFIMKKNSCTAVGLTVVTGNHGREIGQWFNVSATNHSEDIEKDVLSNLEEALKRELREELGYVIKPIKYLGVIKDYYNLINRRNINHYFLVEAIDEVETSLTEDEKNKFHLSRVLVSLEEAIKVYEQIKNTKLGRLVYRREIIPLTYVKNSI